MKKVIKINLIILVIFCLLCNLTLEINATSQIPEGDFDEVLEEFEEQDQTVDGVDGVENIDDLLETEEPEESELDKLQVEKSNLESEIESSNEQIMFIESELSVTVAEIAAINQKIVDKQMEIETLEAQEVEILKYIEEAEKELEKSNKRYDGQKELLEERLVAMYEMGETSYLDLLLNSSSIMDFLSNYFLIEEIAKADTELLETVEAEKKYNYIHPCSTYPLSDVEITVR